MALHSDSLAALGSFLDCDPAKGGQQNIIGQAVVTAHQGCQYRCVKDSDIMVTKIIHLMTNSYVCVLQQKFIGT